MHSFFLYLYFVSTIEFFSYKHWLMRQSVRIMKIIYSLGRTSKVMHHGEPKWESKDCNFHSALWFNPKWVCCGVILWSLLRRCAKHAEGRTWNTQKNGKREREKVTVFTVWQTTRNFRCTVWAASECVICTTHGSPMRKCRRQTK